MPPEAPLPSGLLCHMVFTDNHFHAILNSTCVKKRFNTHADPGITFKRQARAETEDGAGIGSRKEGTHAVGRTGGILRPHPGT